MHAEKIGICSLEAVGFISPPDFSRGPSEHQIKLIK
jgi:hypothetical protein